MSPKYGPLADHEVERPVDPRSTDPRETDPREVDTRELDISEVLARELKAHQLRVYAADAPRRWAAEEARQAKFVDLRDSAVVLRRSGSALDPDVVVPGATSAAVDGSLYPLAGKKVLLVGINYAPEPTGIAPYTTGLAKALARYADEVRVLTGRPHYPHWTVPALYRRRAVSSK